jgi:hypothetical protein
MRVNEFASVETTGVGVSVGVGVGVGEFVGAMVGEFVGEIAPVRGLAVGIGDGDDV